MGRSYTPKYYMHIDDREVMAWRRGKPTLKKLKEWVEVYGKSLEIGGCNEHISQSLGYVPYPHNVKIFSSKTRKIVVEWTAGMFQIW